VSALPIATIGHGETEQSTLDLATFLGFRKQPHSCREGKLRHHYDITMTSLKHHWQYRDTDITDMNNTEC